MRRAIFSPGQDGLPESQPVRKEILQLMGRFLRLLEAHEAGVSLERVDLPDHRTVAVPRVCEPGEQGLRLPGERCEGAAVGDHLEQGRFPLIFLARLRKQAKLLRDVREHHHDAASMDRLVLRADRLFPDPDLVVQEVENHLRTRRAAKVQPKPVSEVLPCPGVLVEELVDLPAFNSTAEYAFALPGVLRADKEITVEGEKALAGTSRRPLRDRVLSSTRSFST